MYIVKFEDKETLMIIDAESFKVNSIRGHVVFKDKKSEKVALLKMDKIRGIFKQSAFDIKSQSRGEAERW